ncbi:MAG TPA: transcription termination factor Rho [Candidatus Woesebacteria bacterium]|mgnify:FL=1|nr:transcription termination factor Rho [Candidatus Woesebacteria bacterium]HOA11943.1 transcription termination factor Rho [Candidatus Woesebacteria bacterium]HOC07842.1 transcription termination factor Rho [Candidatus Woesebacteria bacterium]HOI05055.1 transcription termination factor Rho [Candidatus Woesebacteria bacterium]HPA62093.1 transcription termination factor Rho [Candidatus Woesebacteria bacterium]
MQNSQDNSVSAIANSVDSKLKSSKSSQEENQSKSTTRVIKRRVGGKSNAAKAETDQASNSSENMNGRSSERSSEHSNGHSSEHSNGHPSYNDSNNLDNNENKEQEIIVSGILDNSKEGHGVLRPEFSESEQDVYISSSQIRRLRLKSGDLVTGPARQPKDNERYWGLLRVDSINGRSVEEHRQLNRKNFLSLTPVFPDEHIKLEIGAEPLSLRLIDLIAPIGKGQRSLIVSPPKAGKTTILKDVALGVATNNPDIHLMAVLVGERPEEVTDIRRHIKKITNGKGEVAASNFDEPAQNQCRVAELALERAKRLVEEGRDVLILLDSITRLARAYNLAMPTSGRTLSGGFDPAALFPPKKFFGAARNFEVPGSLTIIGTALVDTGSRMDDLIYEEFKGTGNQELHLDRALAERRIYPAIDLQRSGTRRDDLLIDPVVYQSIITLHRMLDMLGKDERTATVIEKLKRTKSNKEFLASLKNG